MGEIVFALLFTVALLCFIIMRLQPQDIEPSRSVGDVSTANMRQLLERIAGTDKPRPVGSAENARVRSEILSTLRSFGYQPEVQTAFVCSDTGSCGQVHNVVANTPGRTTEGTLLLMAHYDSVPAGPGAGDDGVGVATLLEIARIFHTTQSCNLNLRFLFDDGEEVGLLGAHAFAASEYAKGITHVINVEAQGTGGSTLLFETLGASTTHLSALSEMWQRPLANSFFSTLYRWMPAGTSLSALDKHHDIVGFNFAFVDGEEHFHTPLDRVGNIEDATLQHAGSTVLAATRALCTGDVMNKSEDSVVFFDLGGWMLFQWPGRVLHLVGILNVCLWGVLFVLFWWRKKFKFSRIIWSCGQFLSLLAGCVTLALVVMGLRALHVTPAIAVAESWWERLLMFGLAFLVSALTGRLFVGRAQAIELWLCFWFGTAIAGLVLTIDQPGVGYLFVVPSLMAMCAGWIWLFLGYPSRWFVGLTLLPVSVSLLLWTPIAWLIGDALGSEVLMFTGCFALIAIFGMAPMWTALVQAPVWLWCALSIVCMCLALGAYGTAPYSSSVPFHVNSVVYHRSTDHQTWAALETTELHAHEQKSADKMFPWTHENFQPVQKIPSFSGPAWTAHSVQQDGAGYRLSGQLRSLQASTTLGLLIPPTTDVRSVIVEQVETRPAILANGWQQVQFFAVPPDGLQVQITTTSSLAELILTDDTYVAHPLVPLPNYDFPTVPFHEGHRIRTIQHWRWPGY